MFPLLLVIGVIVLGPVAVLVLLVLGVNGVLALGAAAAAVGTLAGLAIGSPAVAIVSAACGGACVYGLMPAPGSRRQHQAHHQAHHQAPTNERRQRGATPRK